MRSGLSAGSRALLLLLLLFLVTGVLIPGLLNTMRTVALVRHLGEAAYQTLDTSDLIETELVRWREGEPLLATVYRRSGTHPATALVFVPGLTPEGVRNPRFVAVARALAKAGYLVLTPNIAAFREFRLEEDSIGRISFWYRQLRTDEEFRPKQVGLVGVSVGGTLSLLAVARDPLSSDADFVVSIGGYQDLLRCEARWFSLTASQERHGKYPVQFYGRWIAMMMALETLPDEADRVTMKEALSHLLARGKSIPDIKLSAEATRWYRYAVLDEDSAPDVYERIHDQLKRKYQSLSAGSELSSIHCPVFLVHGAQDELIPPGETEELLTRLTSADTHLLYTPIISHTHPLIDQLGPWDKFVALARAVWLLHSLVRAT